LGWRQVVEFRGLFDENLFFGWLVDVSLHWRLIEELLPWWKAFDSHRCPGNPVI